MFSLHYIREEQLDKKSQQAALLFSTMQDKHTGALKFRNITVLIILKFHFNLYAEIHIIEFKVSNNIFKRMKNEKQFKFVKLHLFV